MNGKWYAIQSNQKRTGVLSDKTDFKTKNVTGEKGRLVMVKASVRGDDKYEHTVVVHHVTYCSASEQVEGQMHRWMERPGNRPV